LLDSIGNVSLALVVDEGRDVRRQRLARQILRTDVRATVNQTKRNMHLIDRQKSTNIDAIIDPLRLYIFT
jgi:hypothetical protein